MSKKLTIEFTMQGDTIVLVDGSPVGLLQFVGVYADVSGRSPRVVLVSADSEENIKALQERLPAGATISRHV